jgi:NTP pyrophosphatase (non-canonical NTP hydrolase)
MSYSFDDYQKESRATAKYPVIGHKVIYPTLGLLGEAGEIAEKIKKMFRDRNGELSQEEKDLLAKELGDVLWYLAQLSSELGLSLSDIAQGNVQKLKDRMTRGVIHGSGDAR